MPILCEDNKSSKLTLFKKRKEKKVVSSLRRANKNETRGFGLESWAFLEDCL